MIIAYVCDNLNYLSLLKVSMASVRRYNKDVKFVILTKNAKIKIDGADIYHLGNQTDINGLYRQNDRLGEGVYYKFFLPKLPYSKVLYIDCDVLCQRPLNELWEQKCDFICATESHSFGEVQAKQLGLKRYALTGMMLMNLDALRQANFTKRCFDRLEQLKKKQIIQKNTFTHFFNFFHDETIINLEFNESIRFIDVKYNYCKDRVYKHPISESDAYLLHFVGGKNQKDKMLKIGNFKSLEPLKKMLKNKKVAIVGNSSKILTENNGAEIDAHDIIIRFNRGFTKGKENALGKRTDLLFLATTLTNADYEKFAEIPTYTIKRSNLCQNACNFNLSRLDREILKQGTAQASTGFIAINYALSCGCASIDLYGFDFFKLPTYYNPEGYKTLHDGESEETKVLEYAKYGLLKIN